MLEIVYELPPNYGEIAAAFNLGCGKPVFCYDGKIYAPVGAYIDRHLQAHETVHVEQHHFNGGSDRWWRLYIDDPAFRLHQETQAYRAQYASLCKAQRDRNFRAAYLHRLASHLSSPLYGSIIDCSAAIRAIRDAP